eukprot:CAMPEP_0183721952 /NCGR_PEP_ID=MMETSP0737-20130205/14052_1 /TAXON_ID=385413 /ORGANISM="Thalassiosira miniscula, Strain CCMP1093" /LENGTH=274 /DNA_ID=CAMNT_0025952023 /DNA_START=95 /DNA_END=919 /DNA_ORIENTATION=-
MPSLFDTPAKMVRHRHRQQQQHFQILLAILITFAVVCIPIPTTFAFSTIPNSNSNNSPPPPFPHPANAEEAVQNQLHYYQTLQLSEAYDCCSAQNQAATGPIEEFERQLKVPPYDLLLGHERADVLLEVLPEDVSVALASTDGDADDDESGGGENESSSRGIIEKNMTVACILVCLRPHRKARRKYPVWFWWEMSKKLEDDTTNNNNDDDRIGINDTTTTKNDNDSSKWMVDCIMPDFEDLDFETESLSIEQFGGGGGEEDNDDELTIYWDFDG